MAFFKFRWPSRGEQRQAEKPPKRTRSPQAESIDEMRRRARHRLIGAAVLVLVGIIGFPLLFDAQPRPIAIDIPIDIPDRNKVAPLVVPAPTTSPTPVAEAAIAKAQTKTAAPAPTGASAVAPIARKGSVAGGLAEGEELVPGQAPSSAGATGVAPAKNETKIPAKTEPKPELRAEVKQEPRPDPKQPAKPETKPDNKPDPKPAQRTDEAARARALLEGRPAPTVSAVAEAQDDRFIVQVGAFADADKAREVRSKVERTGMKTYTQVVDTKDGKRTRVRVGPFANRAEADKAADRIKGLDLPASVLAL